MTRCPDFCLLGMERDCCPQFMRQLCALPPKPYREGEIVKTPSGRLAKVLGYDTTEGRYELRYLSEDDGNGKARVALSPWLLRRRDVA